MAKNRFTNIDVTLKPEYVSLVHSKTLITTKVQLDTLTILFLSLYTKLMNVDLEEVTKLYEETLVNQIVKEKLYLSKYGEVNFASDDSAPLPNPPNP